MVRFIKRLFKRRADRSLHILRKGSDYLSICGVNMRHRAHLIYTVNRKDTFKDLENMRVCLSCIRGLK